MEPTRDNASGVLLSTLMEKLTIGSESISCVYPSCQSSAPVELFNVHVARCRRKWRGPMIVCRYNGAHVVPAPEERYHSLTCTDRWLHDEDSGCKDTLEVTKVAIRLENDGSKKSDSETSSVTKKRTQTAYFLRGARYAKWRNAEPRLQNFYSKQSGMKRCIPSAGGRSHWRGSSMNGRGRSRGFSVSTGRNTQSEMVSLDADDSPSTTGRGFLPWASSKPHSSMFAETLRRNSMARTSTRLDGQQ